MRPVLLADEVRALETESVVAGAKTLRSLMRRAGEAVAHAASQMAPQGRILVVCGRGNNGGDGWTAALLLAQQGRDVVVLALGDSEDMPEPARSACADACAAGVVWHRITVGGDVLDLAGDAALVIDAVLGIGLRSPVRDDVAAVLDAMAACGRPVLAVDVPSGIDADTGALLGPVPRASRTVTFTCLKPGLVLYPAAEYAGDVVVADIGLTVDSQRQPRLDVWDPADYADLLPTPAPDAHKGDRGSVLVVAGSRLYAGAAVLAASGAMRMGAGYVFAAVPASIVPVVQSTLPHVIAVGLTETPEGAISEAAAEHIVRLARDVDAVVLGPGLTTHASAVSVVRSVLSALSSPIVVDADALNALRPEDLASLRVRVASTVITPHPGELARLVSLTTADVQSDRVRAARSAAGPRCACVLKGARTVIACGKRAAIVCAGNPGMATAGMGDVLAGMIGTLLAQGMEPMGAASLGAYLHARAGDLAAEALTFVCLTAKDLPAYLPAAVRELLDERRPRAGSGRI